MKKFLFIVLFCFFSIINIYSQANVIFDSLADMTSKRYGMGYASDGAHIFAVSGGTNMQPWLSTTLEIYNIANNAWSEYGTGLLPRRYNSAEYISTLNKLFIFNGNVHQFFTYTDTIEIVDLSTGELAYNTSNPYPVEYAGSAVWNDRIYIFGGSNNNILSNRLYEFNPTTFEWIRLPDMPEAKQTSGKIVNGILYVFGGYNGTSSRRIDAYDIQTKTWAFIDSLPVGISAHATAVSGESIWLVGNYTDLQSLYVFNSTTYDLLQVASNMKGRRHAGAVIIDSSLYIFGGAQTSNSESALQSLEYANISNYIVSIPEKTIEISNNFELYQNYPNPFNPSTIISYQLTMSSAVKLSVYDDSGQEVRTLINEKKPAGQHSVTFNATGLASGIYFYQLKAGSFEQCRKMLLLR